MGVTAPPTTHMPVQVRPLMAWQHAGRSYGQQRTHAVLPGQSLPACGTVVNVLGSPWLDPPASSPQARCPVCTQAVYGAWAGADYARGTR